MKAVLMSIRPKWVKLIESGKKTVEVRRSYPAKLMNSVDLSEPFKVFIYCSRGKDRLIDIMRDGEVICGEVYHGKPVFITISEEGTHRFRQMVIGEFTCRNVRTYMMDTASIEYLSEVGCMSEIEILKYAGNRMRLYSWEISDLKWYGNPKPLSDFGLTRPPQAWQYVEVPDDL